MVSESEEIRNKITTLTVPRISLRAQSMPASPIRKLVPLAEQAKTRGIKIYHLNIGQPDIPTPREFLDAVRRFDKIVVEYANSKGDARLIDALVGYYRTQGIKVTDQEIQITTGGSEAILFALLCVCSPGDSVLVFEPFYTNYNGFGVVAGVSLVPVGTVAESGYHLPAREVIEAKITPRCKAIMITTPNNPTGTLYSATEMQMLAEIAVDRGLFLISDETYREFVYEGRHISVMNLPEIEERAILVDSISKRYSVCGARIGCLVSRNPEIQEAALRFAQSRLSSPTVEMEAATAVLKLGAEYFGKVAEEYRRRRDLVLDELRKIPGSHCVRPEGAFYVMATLPVDDVEEFARWMLADFSWNGTSTMVAPGPGFYATPNSGRREARIAYVLNLEDLRKAMQALAKGIEAYQLR